MRFSNEFKSDFLLLLEDFEIKKRSFSQEVHDFVTLRVPTSLQHILAQNADFSELGGTVYMLRDKLKISGEKFQSFFEVPVKAIVTHVLGLRKMIKKPIKAILMVGGFSESPVLQNAMKDTFAKTDVNVIIPIDASLCVLKGAVLYGFSPCSVAFRTSRFTYGVAMTAPFDEGRYPERKKVVIGGANFCDDVFDKHVEVDQTIPSGIPLQERRYYPFTDNDKTFSLMLYRSSAQDPQFINDPGCVPVGIFELPVERSLGTTKWDRALQVQLLFGAADIHVRTIQSNKKYREAIFKLNP